MKRGKLDARYSGFGEFKYYAGYRNSEVDKFCAVRAWCWENWGPSCEMENYGKVSNPNINWCWISDQWKQRIYFASDKEYQWFLLKYGS
jgi:hypothetical protein